MRNHLKNFFSKTFSAFSKKLFTDSEHYQKILRISISYYAKKIEIKKKKLGLFYPKNGITILKLQINLAEL